MKDETLPSVVDDFAKKHPSVWDAYNRLGDMSSEAGPLDEKTQRLIKLAIAIGTGHQGAVRSHTRRGLRVGLTPEELSQVAMLAITTAGWPQAFAAYCWIQDIIAPRASA